MNRISDFKVGLMVTAGIALFLTFHWIIEGVSFEKEGKEALVSFTNLSGVRVGTDVKVAGGVKVGKVRGVTLLSNRAVLSLWLKRDTRITTTTTVSIGTVSILGEKYVSVEYGKEPGTPLPSDFVIQGQPPFSITGSVEEFGALMRKFNTLMGSGGGKQLINRVDNILRDTGARLQGMMKNSEQELKTITSRLSLTTVKLNSLLDEFKGSGTRINSLLGSLERNSRHLEGSLPDLVTTIKRFSAAVTGILESANKKKTLLYLLASDKKAYYDIMFILDNLKTLTYRLKKDPSIILWKGKR